MKIQKITSRSRRDFTAIYECDHCGHTEEGYGYDDNNFHKNVIPTMKCSKCGKMGGGNYAPRKTKYAANEVV